LESDLQDVRPVEPARPAAAGRRGLNAAQLRGDVTGALVAAVVTISESVPLGLLAFAAFGASFVGMGVIAGLYGAVAAGLVAALFGGAPRMISGPRASVVVIMATMVSMAAAAPGLDEHGGPMTAVAIAFLGVFLAGFLEMLFGVVRLGRVIKFIPYPVIAGFMNGVAILLLLSQMRSLIGLPDDFALSGWSAIAGHISPWGAFVAGSTMIMIGVSPKIFPRLPGLLTGLAGGLILHFTLGFFCPGGSAGAGHWSNPRRRAVLRAGRSVERYGRCLDFRNAAHARAVHCHPGGDRGD